MCGLVIQCDLGLAGGYLIALGDRGRGEIWALLRDHGFTATHPR